MKKQTSHGFSSNNINYCFYYYILLLFFIITLSSGNLLCPNEANVILWEPTKQKLLDRLVLIGAAATEGQISAETW